MNKSFWKKILIISTLCFLLSYSSKTFGADRWIFWWGDPPVETGIVTVNGSIPFSSKADCENSSAYKNVNPSHPKSNGCYKAEDVKISSISFVLQSSTGIPGEVVDINGDNLLGVTEVSFGTVKSNSFFTKDSKTLGAEIPVGAVTGKITVKTKYHGETTSPKEFVVIATPPNNNPWAFVNVQRQYKGPYDTKQQCEEALKAYLDDPANGITEEGKKDKVCSQHTLEEIKNSPSTNPVPVSTKKNVVNDDVYRLLAPIGDFKEINTKGGACPGNPDIENGIGCYLNIIFKIAIGLCGALAVIMIVIGGITYMGTESVFGKTEAKSRIFSALMGLFIALGAYAILNTINPALTGKEGVSVDQVTAEIDDESETEPVTTYYQVTGKTKLCTSGYTDVNTFGNGDAKQPKKINICNSINGIKIANNLQDMINEAKKSNVILSGYGSRSYDRQVQLRKDHKCPDVYNSPASTCKPPTARPGHSNHEVGGAVDFTCNGQSMVEAGGRNSPCFKWLSTHASGYKFYNLKSESWHWSFNGK